MSAKIIPARVACATLFLMLAASPAWADGTIDLVRTSYATGEAMGQVSFAVRRSSGTSGAASVSYATADAGATAGTDYTAATGTLTWADGEGGVKSIVVALADDDQVEPVEGFTLTLSNATGATLGAAQADVKLVSDDSSISMTRAVIQVDEHIQPVVLTARRVGALGKAATVDYVAVSGTAFPGEDYVEPLATLVWGAGQGGERQVVLNLVNDERVEPPESFTVQLRNAQGQRSGSAPRHWCRSATTTPRSSS